MESLEPEGRGNLKREEERGSGMRKKVESGVVELERISPSLPSDSMEPSLMS